MDIDQADFYDFSCQTNTKNIQDKFYHENSIPEIPKKINRLNRLTEFQVCFNIATKSRQYMIICNWKSGASCEKQNIHFQIPSDEIVGHLIENYFPFEFASRISTSFTVDLLGIYVYAANNSHLQIISQL